MEDTTIEFKVTITGDGSKLLKEHLEEIIKEGIEMHGIITEYEVTEIEG